MENGYGSRMKNGDGSGMEFGDGSRMDFENVPVIFPYGRDVR
jgi:hypothetical protein